jgi:hypothetical protein
MLLPELWLALPKSSELWNGLELADDPAVGRWRHQHDIVNGDVLSMNGLASVKDFEIVLSSIVQFNNVTLRGVEDGLQFVNLIRIPGANAASSLTGYGVV